MNLTKVAKGITGVKYVIKGANEISGAVGE